MYRYLIGKVRGDLPAVVVAPDPDATDVTGTLAGALRALAGTREEAEDPLGRGPKTVQEVYKETYRTLLRFCNVAQPTEVAPVWSRLANCAKSEQHTILVQELQ